MYPEDEGLIILTRKRKRTDEPVFLRQYSSAIIDIFEDFLDEKGVTIPNNDRDDDNSANIYGEDFDNIMNKLETPLLELVKKSHNAKYVNTDTYN